MAFTFGAKTTASTNPFGQNTATTGFGTKPAGGGLFGSGGGTGFGAKSTSGGFFGSTGTSGFGAKSTAGGLFGSGTGTGFGAKSTAGGLFGSGGSSAFGVKSTASGGLFGGGGGGSVFNFGKTTASTTTTSFSGFQTGSGGGGLFGNNASNQLQTQQQSAQDAGTTFLLNMASALSAPMVFGDERDSILAKWNQVQAFYGFGKGYYRRDGSHVTFTPENYFCRFKAVGYSRLPTMKDEKGLVAIVMNKKESEVRQYGEANISQGIHKILDSKPNISVKIDSIRGLPGDKTEITIYVEEQSTATGNVKRILASELYAFICQQRIQVKLQQEMAAESCMPRAAMKPEQIKQILENPPSGIDPVVWEQAIKDNPNPESLIPVPMVGFKELENRLIHQESMAKQHQARLNILSDKLRDLQEVQVNTQAKIEQYRRKYQHLSHRVLQVISAQEVCRNAGFAIQPHEEQLRIQLEALHSELNAPTQCRGRLNEMLSQMRMQHHHHTLASSVYSGQNRMEREGTLDDEALAEIKQHLKKQQEGLNKLISLIKEDMEDLKIMETELSKEVTPGNSQQPSFVPAGGAYAFGR